jgi:hypothetical protein
MDRLECSVVFAASVSGGKYIDPSSAVIRVAKDCASSG